MVFIEAGLQASGGIPRVPANVSSKQAQTEEEQQSGTAEVNEGATPQKKLLVGSAYGLLNDRQSVTLVITTALDYLRISRL